MKTMMNDKDGTWIDSKVFIPAGDMAEVEDRIAANREAGIIPMNEYTALPWRGGQEFYIHDPNPIPVTPIRGPLGELIAEVRYPDRKPGKANAAFIVRACNSHTDLLAALHLCVPVMTAHCEASHLTDGFKPKGNKNDRILGFVQGVMERATKGGGE